MASSNLIYMDKKTGDFHMCSFMHRVFTLVSRSAQN